jgi:hypothetical protein
VAFAALFSSNGKLLFALPACLPQAGAIILSARPSNLSSGATQANGAVEPPGIVVFHEAACDPAGVF